MHTSFTRKHFYSKHILPIETFSCKQSLYVGKDVFGGKVLILTNNLFATKFQHTTLLHTIWQTSKLKNV